VVRTRTFTDDGYDHLDDEFDGPERKYRVHIVKLSAPRRVHFFTVAGFIVSHKMTGTLGLFIQQWLDEQAEIKSDHTAASPRRLVNDMTGKGQVPSSVTAWIVEEFGSQPITETIAPP
jgi:hypothetical protein